MHESVRALLASAQGNDASEAILERARALTTFALALGWSGPPFDMEELASLSGLRVTHSRELESDQDAYVVPGEIVLNYHKPQVRQRYSVAHEIAHTLFPDYSARLKAVGRMWRSGDGDSELERLCQLAASELIMPEATFAPAVKQNDPNVSEVLRLASEYDVSPEACARRYCAARQEEVLAVLARPADEDSSRSSVGVHNPRAALAIREIISRTSSHRKARGESPPAGSSAMRAWKRFRYRPREITVEEMPAENWESVGITGLWHGSAVALPRGARHPIEVLSLLLRASASGL